MVVESGIKAQVGQQVPDIALPTLDGRSVSLHQFRGKKLVLFMWASW